MGNKEETIGVVFEDTIYRKEEKVFELDFKGRTFTVNKWWVDDPHTSDYDNDYEIAEKEEFDKLSDEEQDELNDFIFDLK